MMADLKVGVSSVKQRYGYGETIHLRAKVENVYARALYLVMGRVYPAAPQQGVMTVLHGQVESSPNASYFAYRPPELKRLRPGHSTEFEFAFATPLHEYGFGSNGLYTEWEVSVSGTVTLTVVLGYLLGPFRPKTAGPWGEFMRLQKLSPPKSVTVRISAP
jgi:hypothetical protein